MDSEQASSSSSPFPPTLNFNYDVFLSFRGEDVPKNFANHLYSSLKLRRINVFRDTNLQSGTNVSELLQAIKDSRISVIIFSMNYASSTWCLDKLAQAFECMKVGTQIVLPVFYGVDPSEVRKQTGRYGEAIARHEIASRESGGKVEKWKTALTKIGYRPGWDLNDRDEEEAIQDIVEDLFTKLYTKLCPRCLGASTGLVGIDCLSNELISRLCVKLDDVRKPRIGKRTLAQVVFHKLSGQFDKSTFLSDVREADERHDSDFLQGQLLDNILGAKNIKVRSVHQGIDLISQSCGPAALDDVNRCEQLRSLAGSPDCFVPGSRVITTIKSITSPGSRVITSITTRDENFLLKHGLEKRSDEVMGYSLGLPLAQGLGSFFRGSSVTEWQSELERLKEIPNVVRNTGATLMLSDKQPILHLSNHSNGLANGSVDGWQIGKARFSFKEMLSDLLKQPIRHLSNHSNVLVDCSIDERQIGKLLVFSKEIAKGSNGTVVLDGSYEGRPVAVKRLVKSHHDLASKEIDHLIAFDHHQNIVRYHGVESDEYFVYLALERCTCSLDDLIHNRNVELCHRNVELWKGNGYPSEQLLKLMRDIVSGLAHLHKNRFIHRDLKPQNVLITKEPLCAKISDMGISKSLPKDMSSLSYATGCGTRGWQAPEQIRQQDQTRAIDIFNLGCVLYFCITAGKHPFGDHIFEIDGNILKDQKELSAVENIPEAIDLVSRLLDSNPYGRPEAQEVSNHPLFWTSKKRLSFLQEASDHFERERKHKNNETDLLNAIESEASVALDGNWNQKMDEQFINCVVSRRKYKYDSVRELVRLIRNQSHHYGELPPEIQELLGSYPEGFDNYFSCRFPKLLIEVYKVVCEHCKKQDWFRKCTKSDM